MWLYDSGLNQIDFDDDGGSALFSRIDRLCGDDALPAGSYYVQVDEFGDNDEIGIYNLAVNTTECACVEDLVLENETITGAHLFIAGNTITLGPNLVVDGTSIQMIAGALVVFRSDTVIGGNFSVIIDPNVTCP
jgi:hypothetical protein